MKKMNFIKKENKKVALLSMLFLVLSCSNKTGNNSESTNSTTEQQKTVSPEELKKYTKNAAQTQDAFVGVHNSVKDSIVNIRTKKNCYGKYLQSFGRIVIWTFWRTGKT